MGPGSAQQFQWELALLLILSCDLFVNQLLQNLRLTDFGFMVRRTPPLSQDICVLGREPL